MTIATQPLLPEIDEFVALAHDLAASVATDVDAAEADERYPRDGIRTLGRAGMLGLPYDERYNGGGQSTEVYLRVLEEVASLWVTLALSVSVHVLACLPVARFGTDEQRERLLPDMLGGELLGAYCLSESHAGSDPAAMTTRAVRDGDAYVLTGAKAWITHGGDADFYTVLARTSDDGGRGISCFHVPAGSPGLSASPPEHKMGLTGSHTATIHLDGVRVPVENRIGEEGKGLSIAFTALDPGRLGIAAIATGLSRAALELAVSYAKEREAFGKPIIEHEGLGFLLADMDAAVESSRAMYLAAGRRRDAGLPYSREASIAKLIATDNAMKVTTDGVQVLGGAGYTRDFPMERYMREAKVTQIFEGTNQIQRLVIARELAR
jgi:alkylation response protein AidB-like acyl-CoA dehydrogenase